jgi:hypothetical protein
MAHVAPKSKVVTLKLTPEHHKLIDQRARRCGVRMSQWMRSILLQAATKQPDQGFWRIREPDGVTS